jgi:hypothetical protein
VVSFTLRPLYSRWKSPRFTVDRRLGGSRAGRSGRGDKEKITLLPLPGIEPRNCVVSAPSLSALITSN